MNNLKEIARKIRRESIRMIYEGKDGHPGPALSIADIVTVLYFAEMRIDPANPEWEDRDRFILSKGHACPILYAALSERGFFGQPVTNYNLRSLGSIFQGHPVMHKTPGVDFTSGSLGNGIAVATGIALAGKCQKKSYTVFVITGDGELQEGIVWEGLNTAAARGLDNIIVFVDRNGWQSGGMVNDILHTNNVAQRFEAFGWHAQEIDGHDFSAIQSAITHAKHLAGKPSVIVCNCIKGKGVSYMENNNAWHKGVPGASEYALALQELGGEVQ